MTEYLLPHDPTMVLLNYLKGLVNYVDLEASISLVTLAFQKRVLWLIGKSKLLHPLGTVCEDLGHCCGQAISTL